MDKNREIDPLVTESKPIQKGPNPEMEKKRLPYHRMATAYLRSFTAEHKDTSEAWRRLQSHRNKNRLVV